MTLDKLFEDLQSDCILIVVPTEYDAQKLADHFGFDYFPSHDVFPFENVDVSFFVRSARIKTLWKILFFQKAKVVSTLHAITRKTLSPEVLRKHCFQITIGQELKEIDFEKLLYLMGYERTFLVRSGGEYAIRGDILDFFGPLQNIPVRVEFFGRKVESIRIFDPATQRSIDSIKEVTILPVREYISENHDLDTIPGKAMSNSTILDYAKFEVVFVNYKKCQEEYVKREKEIREILTDQQMEEYQLYSQVPLSQILEKISNPIFVEADLDKLKTVKIQTSAVSQIPVVDEEELVEGDYVVHVDYGIGIFEGVRRISNVFGTKEYLCIKYEDSTVYVPVERLDRVQKYIGDKGKVKIDKIRLSTWNKRLEKVKKDVREKIQELVELYFKRQQVTGLSLKGDPDLETEFAKTFPYVETEDQMKAIEEVLEDLASDKPADRLICGDAGFGKTEVALRAAFRCVVSGKQVAVLAPTTVLARQHYETFKSRMEKFSVSVKLLDRTISQKERKQILFDLKSGKIDVIVGTHSLLSDKVKFFDLGLVIIDEEQNFGVEQKEKFKKMRLNVNIISMSATPIPRTLHMALSGMKDLSVLNTPPQGRLPVITYVGKYNDLLVRSAVLREVNRGGQVIYVHNRVNDLERIFRHLQELIPEVKMVMAHGQMSSSKLSKAVRMFYEHEVDMIVCTSIIENGVDVPTANTLIVDDSYRYGIAQLYQLRGRVGRSDKRGFAYFLYDVEPSPSAKYRLKALEAFKGAGSGLQLAMLDMQMRGIGSIFGFEQHGNINSVGLSLYLEILNREIKQALSLQTYEPVLEEENRIDVEIEGIPGELVIPESYVANPMERMRLYRKLAACRDLKEIEEVRNELLDRFGKIPQQVNLLLDLFKIRILSHKVGLKKISYDGETLKITGASALKQIKLNKKHIYNEKEDCLLIYGVEPQEVLKILHQFLE
ncbi:transcription-repair coupling factor [Pseudothermotoga thermarum DSM 5069]|uniref:Transcription-repair-coupling factor n=1 Tax=Pseudothermotoga thermarum DSM 5069 TaxID=688269 RepID=F7YXZ5_9THEM|nr:transcription-repair coupling factor [Pseudothermotoga thermarum DSM 5069]